MSSRSFSFLAALAVSLQPAAAQPTAEPEFEVASIRPHTAPLHTIMGHTISGSRVVMEGYTVAQLVMEAYHLKGMWQLSFASMPDRDNLLSTYYDVTARAPGETVLTRDQSRAMLRTLLADRFKLAVHRVMKDLPVYDLVPGKSGPKLKENVNEGACSVRIGVVKGGQSYVFSNCGIDHLTDVLSNGLVDRPVVDHTGLTGKYDFQFAAMPLFMSHDQADVQELSPFMAIRDLGFKLQGQTAAVEVIAVDHFEVPSAN